MTFHVAQLKYVNFLDRLMWHTADMLAQVSPRPSWFILGAMSALGVYLVS